MNRRERDRLYRRLRRLNPVHRQAERERRLLNRELINARQRAYRNGVTKRIRKVPNRCKINNRKRFEKLNKEIDASDSGSELLYTKVLRKEKILQVATGSKHGSTSDGNENLLYACLWDNCHHQFDNQRALMCHLDMESYGHIWQSYSTMMTGKFECLWYNCERIKKNLRPFTSCLHLIHHVKACHLKMYSNDILAEYQKKKEELSVVRSSLCDPTIFTIEVPPPLDPLMTQPNAVYAFEGKCKKCNFSNKQVYPETSVGCNTGIVPKCMLCPTTKVIGMDVPSQSLIARDHSTTKPGSVKTDSLTGIDATPSNAATPKVFGHTRVISSISQLYGKSRCIRKTPTHSIPNYNSTCSKLQDPLVILPQVASIKQKRILPKVDFIKQKRILPKVASIKQKHILPKVDSIKQKRILPKVDSIKQKPILPKVASIKQKGILTDDRTNKSFINQISLPTRDERVFNADRKQSPTKPERVQTDALTGIDATHSNAATPNVFGHTRVISSIRQLYGKSRSIQKTPTSPDNDTSVRHFKPHATPQVKILTTRVPNNSNPLPRKKTIHVSQLTTTSHDNDTSSRFFKPPAAPQMKILVMKIPSNHNPIPRKKRMHRNSSQYNPIIVKLQKQPVEQPSEKVSAKLKTQQSVYSQALIPIISQSQNPVIDFPQVASIKEEVILPDDGTIPSFINSSLESTKVNSSIESTMFSIKQESTEELTNVPSDNTSIYVTENINITSVAFAHSSRTSLQWPSGQLSSSTAMDVNTPCDIVPTDVLTVDLNLVKEEPVDLDLAKEPVDLFLVKKGPVDLNLVKKEIDDETLFH